MNRSFARQSSRPFHAAFRPTTVELVLFFATLVVLFILASVVFAQQERHDKQSKRDHVQATAKFSTVSGEQNTDELNAPTGIAVDSAGNIIVADAGNFRICAISPKGVVKTLAGGTFGWSDGSAEQAQFFQPTDVAVDASGTIFVLDANRVRTISPSGNVTTLAGGIRGCADGKGASAQFNMPTAFALDREGNVIVADAGNNRLRKIFPDGTVTTFTALTAPTTFTALTALATLPEQSAAPLKCFRPVALAVDNSGGIVLVNRAESSGQCIVQRIIPTPAGCVVDSTLYQCVAAVDVQRLNAMTMDNAGNVFAIDNNGDRIQKISPSGVVSVIVNSNKRLLVDSSQLFSAADVVVDALGNLLFTDARTNSVRRIILP